MATMGEEYGAIDREGGVPSQWIAARHPTAKAYLNEARFKAPSMRNFVSASTYLFHPTSGASPDLSDSILPANSVKASLHRRLNSVETAFNRP
jgi:hypothetical protein